MGTSGCGENTFHIELSSPGPVCSHLLGPQHFHRKLWQALCLPRQQAFDIEGSEINERPEFSISPFHS